MVRSADLPQAGYTGIQGRIAAFVEHPQFTNVIIGLIVLNAVLLGLETNPAIKQAHGGFLFFLDHLILGVFVAEIILKLLVYRLSFFREGWNTFDFVIIGGSLFSVGGTMAILRTLRIFRMLRLMSIVPSMRRVITALFKAVPGMASIIGIMLLIFYVAAVLATQIFGSSPDPLMQEFFGSMGRSMYTLFQVMTLEGWPDVARPTIALFSWAWVYFIVFIVVTAFAVLNLFVGIIVDAMDIVHDFEEEGKGVKDLVHREADDIHRDLDSLRNDIAEIKSLLKK